MQLTLIVDFGSDLIISATVDDEPVEVDESVRDLAYELALRMCDGKPVLGRLTPVGEYSPVDYDGPWDD